jgi:Abnormal spindle-like microcephaly-assoc'd, ASPM-SPD-2-Hydin
VGSGSTSWFFFLLDPASNSFSSSVTPGQNLTVSNGYCSLNGATTTVNTSGNAATIALSLSFSNTFSGSHRVTASYCDGTGGSNCSPDITIGTWQVNAAKGLAQLTSSSLTFGHQNILTTSVAQHVTLTNNGQAALNISSITASTEFGLTHNCPASLAVNGTCTLDITFQPQSAGTKAGSVTIVDDALNTPQTITLSGIGDLLVTVGRPTRPGRGGVVIGGAAVGGSSMHTLAVKLGRMNAPDSRRTMSCSSTGTISCSVLHRPIGASGRVTLRLNNHTAPPGHYTIRLLIHDSAEERILDIPIRISGSGRIIRVHR